MGGTIVELGLVADEFALGKTAAEFDDLQYEVERFVAYDSERVMPYIWIDGPSIRDIDPVLEADDSIADFDVIAELEDERLYQMEWVDQIETLVHILVEEEGSILSAHGNGKAWTLRILFPDRQSLARTHEYCMAHDFSIDILSIYDLSGGRKGRFGLTDDQQDALELAFDNGYYEIPREQSMIDIADEMDITHQALSERLRRGHRALVENTVIIGREEPRPQRDV